MTTVAGTGTPELAWARWQLERLPPLEVGVPARAVVVAPHPDDEVLAAGGLMQRLATAGVALTVVSVTDGEASHPRSPTIAPPALADRRRGERGQALRRLGVGGTTVARLGLPDGGVAQHEAEVEASLTAMLAPGVACIAPWCGDGHPDHDATGRAAAAACAATGATFSRYLVWTWHWATPADDRVPWAQGRLLTLTRAERTRKRCAVRAFATQVTALSPAPGDEAILVPEMLAHFDRPYEVFLA